MVHHRRFLAIISAILFLTFLDNTIVSVVLAGVQSDLGAGVQALQWIVDSYMLVFAALMLTGGTLGDIFGRKRVLLSGVALFSAGSLLSMLGPSSSWLIGGRILMGVGAAASEPGTLSLIRHVYAERRPRLRALGIWAAVSSAALAFGPIVGGAIATATSWRQIFTFNFVLGILLLAAGFKWLPESADPAGRRLDIPGLLLGTLALAAATIAVISGETYGYAAWWIGLLFALSILALAAFILWEIRYRDPVLRLSLFRSPAFSGAMVVAFAVNFAVFAVFFFTTLYLSIVAGFSGYDIALAFLAMAAAMVAAAAFTGRWLAVHGPAVATVAGCLLAAVGLLVVNALMQPNVSTLMLAWPLAIVGLGFGVTLVTATALVLNIAPAERSGMAASAFNTSRELGGVFGVAVLGSLVNGQLTAQLAHRLAALGLPSDFQSLAIYGVTHGGHLPSHVHVNAGAILSHPQLVEQVTSAAYQAFAGGLDIALKLAAIILFAAAIVAALTMRRPYLPTEVRE